jgi:hypothetical protein
MTRRIAPDASSSPTEARTTGSSPAPTGMMKGDLASVPGESAHVPAIVAIGSLAAVMYLGIRPVSDNDAWWHLKVGEYLLNGGLFVGPDPWNPFATRPFVVNQWLPEVVAFKGYEWFGLPAVAWLRCVAILLLFTAILWCTRYVADTVPALIIALATLIGTAGGLGERPQLVSFVMLAVWVGASWRTAEDLRPRWWLIPLTWVWLTGIGIGIVVIVGLWMDRRVTVRAAARLMIVPLASLGVCALTPVGPRLLLAPFEVSQIATEFVQEWQPTPVRTSFVAILTLVMIAAAVLGWIRTPDKTPWWQVGLAVAAPHRIAAARTEIEAHLGAVGSHLCSHRGSRDGGCGPETGRSSRPAAIDPRHRTRQYSRPQRPVTERMAPLARTTADLGNGSAIRDLQQGLRPGLPPHCDGQCWVAGLPRRDQADLRPAGFGVTASPGVAGSTALGSSADRTGVHRAAHALNGTHLGSTWLTSE